MTMRFLGGLFAGLALGIVGTTAATNSFPVHIRVDAGQPLGEWKPIWRFFGADEPNYATMTNGSKLLGELGALKPKQVYFRAHNLLCSGDGTPALKWGSTGAYAEDADGKPIYNWTILDAIFDTYFTNGVRPYAQIGFMPEALSIHPQPYQHHWKPGDKYSDIETGWAYPPKDYAKWSELVYQWVKHCVERYGRAEVETWYWEVWNEANGSYWKAKPEEFRKLHDYAVAGVRRALPAAKVGGPDSAGSGGQWTRDFLEHCLRGTNFATGQIGTPLDFVAFHAKGSPVFTNGHVRMGIANQLAAIDSGFSIIKSYPELKIIPIVIGESDPEGCAACTGDQLGYRNGTMYSSYTAAVFARKLELARRHGVNLEGALTWAFTFENQPLFAGFRQLASGSIDLPVLNVFRMFSQMGGHELAVASDGAISLDEIKKTGVRGQPDVSAQATLDGDKLCAIAWHYHDDDVPGAVADVSLELNHLPWAAGAARLTRYAIDAEHSNAYAAWQKMGSPAQPTAAQYAQLESAGQLAQVGDAETVRIENGRATVKFNLPRQAVTLLVLQPTRPVFKFSFGTNLPASDFTRVSPAQLCSGTNGFGFEPGASVTAGRDFIIGEKPFQFSVKLPEGNYRVAVTLAGSDVGSVATVKAEARRLMLENVRVPRGESVSRAFSVNVRTPQISSGDRVRLKQRELDTEMITWDDRLTLEFNGAHLAVRSLEISPAPAVPTIFIAGDSTVCDQPREPWNSWGQMLPRFFNADVAVANYAQSGESIKSSLSARRFDKIFSLMKSNDWLLVQFGHNDMKDQATNALAVYRANLKKIVQQTRERGATPVLVTSMERKAGVERDTLAGYPDAVRQVARENAVTLIDLHAMSRVLYRALGTNLDLAFQDGTHHNNYGSYELARCMVEGIRVNAPALAKFVADDAGKFDPAHPDAPDQFKMAVSAAADDKKPDGN